MKVQRRKGKRPARSRKPAKAPAAPSGPTGELQPPQLSPSQKKLIMQQYEEVRGSKLLLADHVLKQREIESLLGARLAQFRATCEHALRAAGVNLDEASGGQYTIDIGNDCRVVHKPSSESTLRTYMAQQGIEPE